jgi:hypothetical protein
MPHLEQRRAAGDLVNRFAGMNREYDTRTGRPLEDGRDAVEALTDDELEVELTVALAEPHRRQRRLDALLLERSRRRLGAPRVDS